MTPSQAYELFLKSPDSFQTTAPSPGEYLEIFRRASRDTEKIICVTVSKKISAVYDAALQARQVIREESPGVTIEVVDSLNAATAEGFVVLAAARALAGGGDLPEATRAALEMKQKITFNIFLDTIRHVYRSGRVPKVASQAGSMLNIKPVLTFSGGEVKFVGVTRSKSGGIERLLKMMRDKVGSDPVHVGLTHAYAPEDAEKLKQEIVSSFNCAELWVGEFSPLMGYAVGAGALGIAFYTGQ